MQSHVIPGCSFMTHRIPIKLQLPGKSRLIYNFARTSCQNRIENLAKGLEEAGRASYLSKLTQSNDCLPLSSEEFPNMLPSNRMCTEANQSVSELFKTDIKKQVLDSLKTEDIEWSHVPT